MLFYVVNKEKSCQYCLNITKAGKNNCLHICIRLNVCLKENTEGVKMWGD